MKEVKLIDWSASRVLDLLQTLRDEGYVQGVDFDFSYHTQSQEYLTGRVTHPKYTKFMFYKEELATWFILKYQ